MAHHAIRASALGKAFRLPPPGASFPTLRDAVTASVQRVFRPGLHASSRARTETLWALRDVSFEVAPGEVVGIVGGNGAGKSTLLKILSRITPPTEGCAEIRGRVGSLIEVGTGFHPELSGRENVYLNGAILGMTRHEIARKFDEIVAFAEVEPFVELPVKQYSSGMYLRLAFAVAAHLEPEILIVDEVLAVGDAAFQKKCLGKMGAVAHQGRTVLFVSHNLLAVQSLCSRAIWLRRGQVAGAGTARDVVSQYLRTSASEPRLRDWADAATAPGNDRLRLRRATVRRRDGLPGEPIDVRTPFVFEIAYWNLDPGAHLHLRLRVYNEQGVLVFEAGPPGDARPCAVGLYRDVCQVPADLMNDGHYSIELLVMRDLHNLVYRHSDLLTLEVTDSVEGRGSWHGKWQGVVRPSLPWETRPIEESALDPS